MLRFSILLSMTISVIIPTHRRVKQVEYLIRSLRDQIFPKEKLQVLLISNLKDHSLRKKSGQWKKEFYDFKYMETGEKGVNKARNLGIRFAGGDILYFLDDDCILPSEDHLTQLVARHQKLTGVAGIGGGYKTADMLKGISQFYYEQQEHWMSAVSGDSCKTSQLIGGNASYKREVFDKGFSFDSRIVFGGSEQSFNHLLVSNGYSLMLFRELDVYHDVRINVLSLIQKSFQQGMGHFKNQLKGKNHEIDMKKEAAFSALPTRSWIHSIYHIFFKLGYFWAGSSGRAEGFVIFRVFFFLFLVLKSRWVIIKNHLLKGIVWKYTTRFLGGIWFYLGALYGVLYVYAIRFLGLMRFYLGTLYGYMIRFLGPLWFGIGILYGYVIRVLGFVWYYLGALYGVLKVSAIRFLGLTRFSIGTLYGYMVQVLGPLWFYVGVLYGYIVRFLGFVWFYLGALYGILHVSTIRFSGLVRFCIGVLYGYMVRFLGVMWFYLGALYGLLYVYVIRFLGLLRFCLGLLSFCVGTLYGYVVRVLGFIWYYLGALYGLLYVYVIRFLGLLRFCLGLLSFCVGTLYGYVVRVLGFIWYYLGALYGLLYVYVIRFLGLLRFCLGLLSFYVGTLYGYVVRALGFYMVLCWGLVWNVCEILSLHSFCEDLVFWKVSVS